MLLISDTNILIDIEDGNLTDSLFKLSYEIAIPDFLFELELREKHTHLLKAGLKIKSLTAQSIRRTEELCQMYPGASMMDHSALALAIQEKCPLLTGDKHLREAALKEGIVVHGTLWVVEELLSQKIIKQAEARISFASMKENGSRLPWASVEELLNKIECIGVEEN